jgi:hypothetical protein
LLFILRDPSKFQHQGFGTLLMEEAERIAREEHGAGIYPSVFHIRGMRAFWEVPDLFVFSSLLASLALGIRYLI